jgi:hypothetical protein
MNEATGMSCITVTEIRAKQPSLKGGVIIKGPLPFLSETEVR